MKKTKVRVACVRNAILTIRSIVLSAMESGLLKLPASNVFDVKGIPEDVSNVREDISNMLGQNATSAFCSTINPATKLRPSGPTSQGLRRTRLILLIENCTAVLSDNFVFFEDEMGRTLES